MLHYATDTALQTYLHMIIVWSVFVVGKKETEVLLLAPIIIYSKQWIFMKF
jgi:hypothetical protein